MSDKMQIQEIFLFEFKMGCKVAETTWNVNNAFAPETVNEYTVQWCSRSFVKETRTLKMEEHSGLPSEVDRDQLRGSLKVILLQLHEKLPKNSVLTILWSFGTWSKLERWESWISECLMRWLQFRRIILKCGLLLFCATTAGHFLIRLWYATKCGFYMTVVTTSSVVGLRWCSRALPTAKLETKKVTVTAWRSAACLIHYSFLNPEETIPSEMYAQQID